MDGAKTDIGSIAKAEWIRESKTNVEKARAKAPYCSDPKYRAKTMPRRKFDAEMSPWSKTAVEHFSIQDFTSSQILLSECALEGNSLISAMFSKSACCAAWPLSPAREARASSADCCS